MDPQLKSILTSVLVAVCGGGVTWAVKVGIVQQADESTITNTVVAGVIFAVGAAIAWWKSRQHTPEAQIAAVNDARLRRNPK